MRDRLLVDRCQSRGACPGAEVVAHPADREALSRFREEGSGAPPWLPSRRIGRRLVLGTGTAAFALWIAGQGGAVAASGRPLRLLAFGDSLVAGYGLAEAETFTAQLEAALRRDGLDVTVLNGGVSGDTSAGGVARIGWALSDRPDAMLLELGANDGLRGIAPEVTYKNLEEIVSIAEQAKVPVLLAGMLAPRNMGADYVAAFDAVFPRLAAAKRLPLIPFFLEGVATVPALNQGDGIHPNAAGIAEIVRRILPAVKALLATVPAGR